jgi:hypothetical protein
VWDEISNEARPVTDAHPVECPLDWDSLRHREWMLNCSGWKTDHVIDLPDGTRIVLESDDRAHTAVIVTQPIAAA